MIDDEPPAVKDENWLKNDGKVRSIILFSITDAQIMHCRQASTSYDTWKALRDFHQKSSLFTKVILLKKICKATYVESTPMSEHILKMKDFFQRLVLIGEELKDSLIVAFLLNNLPESYDSVVMSLGSRAEDQLTSTIVIDRLSEEYERRKDKSSESGELEKAFKTKNSLQPRCFNCNKLGHYKFNCPFLKNSSGKNNSNIKKFSNNQNKSTDSDKSPNNSARIASTSNEVLFSTCKSDRNIWYIDSAATSHMYGNESFFDYIDYSKTENIILANGNSIKSKALGTGYLDCLNIAGDCVKIKISDVLFIPEIEGNLILVRKLVRMGHGTKF